MLLRGIEPDQKAIAIPGAGLKIESEEIPVVIGRRMAKNCKLKEGNLSWTKGDGAWKTMVRRKTGGYPADRTDGVQVYFDTGTSVSDMGLTPDTLYYYRAWSYVTGSEQWSDFYQQATAQTAPSSTEPPISIGGTVFPINKLQVLAPYLSGLAVVLIVGGGIAFKLVRARVRRH